MSYKYKERKKANRKISHKLKERKKVNKKILYKYKGGKLIKTLHEYEERKKKS